MPKAEDNNIANDPNAYFLLIVLKEAFRNIESYYSGKGTIEERIEGKEAIRWIRIGKGTFKWVALASGKNFEVFHQMCLWKISDIRNRAIKKNGNKSMDKKNK